MLPLKELLKTLQVSITINNNNNNNNGKSYRYSFRKRCSNQLCNKYNVEDCKYLRQGVEQI